MDDVPGFVECGQRFWCRSRYVGEQASVYACQWVGVVEVDVDVLLFLLLRCFVLRVRFCDLGLYLVDFCLQLPYLFFCKFFLPPLGVQCRVDRSVHVRARALRVDFFFDEGQHLFVELVQLCP